MSIFNSKINVNSEGYAKNRSEMLTHISKLQELNARGAMISEKRKPRFEARGQLTPRERLARLLDPGMPFLTVVSARPLPGTGRNPRAERRRRRAAVADRVLATCRAPAR